MARFTVRVELYGTPGGDVYEKLHAEMAERNLYKTIIADDGFLYELPHSEYQGIGGMSIEGVRQLAWDAAKAVWANPAVFVTEGEKCAWFNLKRLT